MPVYISKYAEGGMKASDAEQEIRQIVQPLHKAIVWHEFGHGKQILQRIWGNAGCLKRPVFVRQFADGQPASS